MNITALTKSNQDRWNNCHVPAEKGPAFEAVANRILKNKTIYQEIEKSTGVPWWFIGIVHYRESNLDLSTNLAQGDPWNKKSVHVPAGRGPFNSFQEAAVDALTNCPPYAAKNKDWSVGKALTMFEEYNGLGYANRGVPSPYVWAGTDQYSKGKYVADGVYDPDHVDTQLGCAGVLKFLGVFSGTQPKPKDNVSGPAAGVVAGGGFIVAMWEHIQAHPYLTASAAVAVAAVIWSVVHSIRNSNV